MDLDFIGIFAAPAGLAAADKAALPLHALRPAELEDFFTRQPEAEPLARIQGFTGAAGQLLRLPGPDGSLHGAVLGLGEASALAGFGAAAGLLPPDSQWQLQPGQFDRHEAELGFLLGAYRYQAFKSATIQVAQLTSAAERSRAIAGGIMLARDLINCPANVLGPAELASAAQALAARFGAQAEPIEGRTLESRYPTMAAVGAGSARPPVAILLRWQGSEAGADAKFVSLCGKGVCFDTGGYDLKPSAGMRLMKKDMGGAAILLGLAGTIMALDLPIRLELRLGCVENSVSGHAMRPSDILRTRAGLTVEIGNTDAEGRLVLCDLLTEAAAANPDWLIDAATLTGAARVALGPDLPALFCTDEAMAGYILQAGERNEDPLWRMPLHASYAAWLNSPIADLNNVSSKPFAGAITAALFLQHFVPKQISWAHVDTYAWNDSSRPGRPEGGEAIGLRALLGAIERLCTETIAAPD